MEILTWTYLCLICGTSRSSNKKRPGIKLCFLSKSFSPSSRSSVHTYQQVSQRFSSCKTFSGQYKNQKRVSAKREAILHNPCTSNFQNLIWRKNLIFFINSSQKRIFTMDKLKSLTFTKLVDFPWENFNLRKNFMICKNSGKHLKSSKKKKKFTYYIKFRREPTKINKNKK